MLLPVVAALLAAVLLLVLRRGSTPRFDLRRHPRGLAALERIGVDGSDQWLLLRSEDVRNPVVLFVHGKPRTGSTPS